MGIEIVTCELVIVVFADMDSAEENWSTVLVKSCFKEVEHSEYLCLLVPLLGVSLK